MAMGSLVKEDLSVNFDKIEDPRINRRKLYPFSECFIFSLIWSSFGDRKLELLENERLGLLQRFFPFIYRDCKVFCV